MIYLIVYLAMSAAITIFALCRAKRTPYWMELEEERLEHRLGTLLYREWVVSPVRPMAVGDRIGDRA